MLAVLLFSMLTLKQRFLNFVSAGYKLHDDKMCLGRSLAQFVHHMQLFISLSSVTSAAYCKSLFFFLRK